MSKNSDVIYYSPLTGQFVKEIGSLGDFIKIEKKDFIDLFSKVDNKIKELGFSIPDIKTLDTISGQDNFYDKVKDLLNGDSGVICSEEQWENLCDLKLNVLHDLIEKNEWNSLKETNEEKDKDKVTVKYYTITENEQSAFTLNVFEALGSVDGPTTSDNKIFEMTFNQEDFEKAKSSLDLRGYISEESFMTDMNNLFKSNIPFDTKDSMKDIVSDIMDYLSISDDPDIYDVLFDGIDGKLGALAIKYVESLINNDVKSYLIDPFDKGSVNKQAISDALSGDAELLEEILHGVCNIFPQEILHIKDNINNLKDRSSSKDEFESNIFYLADHDGDYNTGNLFKIEFTKMDNNNDEGSHVPEMDMYFFSEEDMYSAIETVFMGKLSYIDYEIGIEDLKNRKIDYFIKNEIGAYGEFKIYNIEKMDKGAPIKDEKINLTGNTIHVRNKTHLVPGLFSIMLTNEKGINDIKNYDIKNDLGLNLETNISVIETEVYGKFLKDYKIDRKFSNNLEKNNKALTESVNDFIDLERKSDNNANKTITELKGDV